MGGDDARRKGSDEEGREREATQRTDDRRGDVDGIGHRILQREGRRRGNRSVEGRPETGEADGRPDQRRAKVQGAVSPAARSVALVARGHQGRRREKAKGPVSPAARSVALVAPSFRTRRAGAESSCLFCWVATT